MSTPTLQIDTTASLIEAIPALLGFVPAQSIVTVLLSGGLLRGVCREGIGYDGAQTVRAVAGQGIEAVVIIAVADGPLVDQALAQVTETSIRLADIGVKTQLTLHVPAIEPGTSWSDLRTGAVGVIADPTLSEIHLSRALEGKTVETDRSQIEARYAPGQGASSADTIAAVQAAFVEGESFAGTTLRSVVETIESRHEPSAALAARVGVLITRDVRARDALLGIGAVSLAVAAEVMSAMSRRLCGEARAHTLTLAGYFAYAEGDGAAAACAFAAARDEAHRHSVTTPSLLGLLGSALGSGIPPEKIRQLIPTGIADAGRFGIELPDFE